MDRSLLLVALIAAGCGPSPAGPDAAAPTDGPSQTDGPPFDLPRVDGPTDGPSHNDGPPFDLTLTDGPMDLSGNGPADLAAGLCPGDTPGVVKCNGVACRIDRCIGCTDGGLGFLGVTCLPDGGEVPRPNHDAGGAFAGSCGVAIPCDGPEDCRAGTSCYLGEFGSQCDTTGFTGPWQLCHTDCDCPPANPHCDYFGQFNLCRCNGRVCSQGMSCGADGQCH